MRTPLGPNRRTNPAESANKPSGVFKFYIVITNGRTCGAIGNSVRLAHGKRADKELRVIKKKKDTEETPGIVLENVKDGIGVVDRGVRLKGAGERVFSCAQMQERRLWRIRRSVIQRPGFEVDSTLGW